jgi:hypothetical protein
MIFYYRQNLFAFKWEVIPFYFSSFLTFLYTTYRGFRGLGRFYGPHLETRAQLEAFLRSVVIRVQGAPPKIIRKQHVQRTRNIETVHIYRGVYWPIVKHINRKWHYISTENGFNEKVIQINSEINLHRHACNTLYNTCIHSSIQLK